MIILSFSFFFNDFCMSFFILVVDVEYSFYLNNCLFWTWVFPYILFFSCFLLFLLFPFFVCFSYSFAIFIVVQSWKGWYPRYPKIKFSTSDFMIFEVLQRVQFPQLCSTILLTSIVMNRFYCKMLPTKWSTLREVIAVTLRILGTFNTFSTLYLSI